MDELHKAAHGRSFTQVRIAVTAVAMVTVFSLLGLVAGCVRPGVGPPPQQPPPPDVQAASFQKVVQEYDAAAADGWDESECRQVSKSFVALSERSHGLPEALFNAGMVLRQCDLHDEAERLLVRASDVHGQRSGNEKAPGYGPALLVLGVDSAQRDDLARARVFFEKALAADPRSPEAYTNLAILQQAAGDWIEAQRNLRRALAVSSDHMAAYLQMALLYLDLAEENPDLLDLTTLVCQQAASRAAQAEAEPVKLAPIHNAWGLALVRRGDIVGAVSQFDRARALDPDLFEAHLNFGSINLSFRGYEAAERAFRKALELRPDAYEANLSLGVALRGLERYDDARRAYEKALEIDERQPDAHYNLGVLAQDYLFGQTSDQGEQLRLLESAKQSYRRFVAACEAAPEACIRQRRDETPRDLRAAALRRIEDCDAIASALDAP